MKFSGVLKFRRIRLGLLFLSVFGFLYAILRLLFYESDPVVPFFLNFFDHWLQLYINTAAFLIDNFDLPYNIEGNTIIFSDHVYVLSSKFLAKKWLLGLLGMIWFFDVTASRKIFGTLILLLIHFVFSTVDIVLLALHYSHEYTNDHSAFHVTSTPMILAFSGFLSYWLIRYREGIYMTLARIKVNTELIEKKLPDILLIVFLYGFLNNFILGWYDYHSWIQFLFRTSALILDAFGYEAQVFKTFLIGSRGSIYMEKGCLGFSTMALFAAIIFLTSDHQKHWWLYMAGGILFLNIVNIFRFVLLFIHIQKNSGYALAMDVHDMYNLIIYAVVFILWVLWFEYFVLKNADDSQSLLLSEEPSNQDQEKDQKSL